MLRVFATIATMLVLAGCAGKVDYYRPEAKAVPGTNSVVINKPRDAVWNAAVPSIGKQYFVINNLDKASGLINVSYSGDPERYIDCGRITSYVKNARGERTYDFPGASAAQSYEIMNDGVLFLVTRRMSLEGRVNLVFEEVGPSQTRVSANTRYVVQRTRIVQAGSSHSDSISFNSGSGASFPADRSGQQSLECVANGALERELLRLVQ